MNTRIRQIGNLFKRKRKNPNEGRIYDARGLAPALGCMGGGNRMPFVLESYEIHIGLQPGHESRSNGKEALENDMQRNLCLKATEHGDICF